MQAYENKITNLYYYTFSSKFSHCSEHVEKWLVFKSVIWSNLVLAQHANCKECKTRVSQYAEACSREEQGGL